MPTRSSRSSRLSHTLGGFVLAALLVPGFAVLASAEAETEAWITPEGLWKGVILYDPGKTEVDLVVELAQAPDGEWVGTVDILPMRIELFPLEDVSVDGAEVSFWLNRHSPHLDRMVRSPFRGTLSADGETIEGTFVEGGENPHPFVLYRIGEPGDPRPEPRVSELHTLGDDADELRQAFNRHRDAVRLVMLLSPT